MAFVFKKKKKITKKKQTNSFIFTVVDGKKNRLIWITYATTFE